MRQCRNQYNGAFVLDCRPHRTWASLWSTACAAPLCALVITDPAVTLNNTSLLYLLFTLPIFLTTSTCLTLLYTLRTNSRPTLRTGIVITRVQSVVVLVRVQAVAVVLRGSKLYPHLRWSEWKIKFKNLNIKIIYIIYRAKILYIFTTTYPRSAFTKILKIKMMLWRQFSNKTTHCLIN